MFDRLSKDITVAMKNKETDKLDVLRFMKSKLIENKTSKNPRSEIDVVTAHYKSLKDSIEVYPEGDKARTKIASELKFLDPYMPIAISEDEVRGIIQNIIATTSNMGAVMKELSPQIKGRFDGKRANEIVKELLNIGEQK